MSIDAGTVYYSVDAKTDKILQSEKKSTKSLTRIGKSMDNVDSKSKKLNTSLTSLSRAIKVVVAAKTIRSMADMVQSYQAMSDRVKFATDSMSEFETVQARVITTSNAAERQLEETQNVYIRTAGALKTLGYNSEQLLDVQESLSFAFAKNSASAQQVNSILRPLERSFSTGTVTVQAMQSIMSVLPSVMNDLVKVTGKTEKEIRQLGFSGKLAASDLSEALRVSLDSNRDAVNKMAADFGGAKTKMTNSITAVLTKLEEESGALDSLTNGLKLAADHVLAFANDSEKIEGVLNGLKAATVSVAAVMAGKILFSLGDYTVAQAGAVKTTFEKIAADRKAAQSALAKANAEKAAASAYLSSAQSAVAATTATKGNIAATTALHSAKTRLTAASKAQAAAQANFNKVALSGATALRGLRTAMSLLGGPVGLIMLAATAFTAFSGRAKESRQEVDLLNESIGELRKETLQLRQVELKEKIEDLQAVGSEAKASSARIETLEGNLRRFPNSDKVKEWERDLLEQKSAAAEGEQELEKYQRRLKEVNAELEKRNNKESEKPDLKSCGGATDEQIEKEKQLLTARQENENTINQMMVDIALANMEGKKLAETKARLSLNEYATNEQISQIMELSNALFDAEQKAERVAAFGDDVAGAIRGDVDPLSGGGFDNQEARYEAERIKEEERYDEQLERLREAKELELEVKGEYDDLEAELKEQHTERLNQIEEAALEEQKKNQEEASKAKLAVMQQFLGSATQITNQLLGVMDEESDGYKAVFAIQKAFAVAQAMVAAELAHAQVLAHDAGILGMGAVATANVVRAMGYASAGIIAGTAIAGGRQYGGGVEADSMYRINETGAPEVFNAANGQQFMLPNTRGDVVSNKDAAGQMQGGGSNVIVNVIESENKGGEVEESEGEESEQIIDVFVSDIMGDGRSASAIQGKFGLESKGK